MLSLLILQRFNNQFDKKRKKIESVRSHRSVLYPLVSGNLTVSLFQFTIMNMTITCHTIN